MSIATNNTIISTILRNRAQAAAKAARDNDANLSGLRTLIAKRIADLSETGIPLDTDEILSLIDGSAKLADTHMKVIESSGRLLLTKTKPPDDPTSTPTQEDILQEVMKGKK